MANLYTETIKRLYTNFVGSQDNIQKQKERPIGILKYELVGMLYDAYYNIKNSSDDNIKSAYLDDIKKSIIKIIDSENQNDVVDNAVKLYTTVLAQINTYLYMNQIRIDGPRYNNYRTLTASEINKCYSFKEICKNIKTNNKNLNVFRIDLESSYFYDNNLKKEMNEGISNTKCTIYTYGERLGAVDFLDKEDQSDRNAYGNSSNYRFDTNFDISFIDMSQCRTNLDKDLFYFANSHTRKNGLIMIGTHCDILDYDALDFLTMYLENVNVYQSDKSNSVFVISGIATKERKKNLHELFSIIKQILETDNIEYHTYNLCFQEKENILFRPTYITEDIVEKAIDANKDFISKMSEDIFKNHLEQSSKEKERKPLIPFNPGQLGLVLVSGDIDGAIQGGDGKFHLIKGGVERMPQTTRETDGSYNITSTVDSISTYVTVLLADGRILHLV